MSIHEIPTTWRQLAEQQRALGAEPQAITLEMCASLLEKRLTEEDEALLSLTEAARATGYSTGHLRRLVRKGEIPDHGRDGSPKVRRSDLPYKAGFLENRAVGCGCEGRGALPGGTSRIVVRGFSADGTSVEPPRGSGR